MPLLKLFDCKDPSKISSYEPEKRHVYARGVLFTAAVPEVVQAKGLTTGVVKNLFPEPL